MKRLLVLLLLICSASYGQTRPDWLDIQGTLFADVKQFGAKGDGTTDDRAAIQAAIDYCLANGHELYISPPKAFYNIGSIHPDTVGTASPTCLLIKHPTSTRVTLSIRGYGQDIGYQATRGIHANFGVGAPWSLIRNEQTALKIENLTLSGSGPKVLLQDSSGFSKSYSKVTFDTRYGGIGCEYGLHIPNLWTSSIKDCLFLGAKVAGLRIGAGESTSTTISNCYASVNEGASNGTDIGFWISKASYSSMINCAADGMAVGFYISGENDGAKTFSMINCGSEKTVLPIRLKYQEAVIDSLFVTGVTGQYVIHQVGTVAGFSPIEIRGSMRVEWSDDNVFVLAGTNKILGGGPFNVQDKNITRDNISWSAISATDRNSTISADHFRGRVSNTDTGTQLVIPLAGESSAYNSKRISIAGVESFDSDSRCPFVFGGVLAFTEYNGDIPCLTLSENYGITSIATSTGLIIVNLANTYATAAEVIIDYTSSSNRTYVDYKNLSLKLQ